MISPQTHAAHGAGAGARGVSGVIGLLAALGVSVAAWGAVIVLALLLVN